MLVCMAGVDHVWNAGDVVQMQDEQAKRLIEAGYAEPAKAEREKAVAAKPERAVKQ